MEIIAIDDEKNILDLLVSTIKDVVSNANVYAFTDGNVLMEFVKNNKCDVAFVDIEIGSTNGITLAKQLKVLYPTINIIFVTGYNQYAVQAFELKASGYVLKPFTKADIERELNDLRNLNFLSYSDVLTVQCFGIFNVFYNGQPINFSRKKTKELLAYLVYKKGEVVNSKELKQVLFDTSVEERNKGDYLQKIKRDLKASLKEVGLQNVFYSEWNKYAIDPQLISCDYYDFLDNKPNGIRLYNGKFMQGYSWAKLDRKEN